MSRIKPEPDPETETESETDPETEPKTAPVSFVVFENEPNKSQSMHYDIFVTHRKHQVGNI